MACRVKLALVEMCYGSSMGSRVEAAAASSAPQPLAFWTSARRLTCTSILVSIVLTLRLCNACAHRSMCSAWCVWSACAEDIGRGRAERTRTRKARAGTRREHVQRARAEHAQSTRRARAEHAQCMQCTRLLLGIGASSIPPSLQFVLLELDRLLVHSDDALQVRAIRTCSTRCASRPSNDDPQSGRCATSHFLPPVPATLSSLPLCCCVCAAIGKRTLAQHQRALLGALDDARHSEVALSGTLVHFAVGGLLELCLHFSSEGSQRPSREHASCRLAQKSSARDCVDPERIGRSDQENSHEGPAQHDGRVAGSKSATTSLTTGRRSRRAASVTSFGDHVRLRRIRGCRKINAVQSGWPCLGLRKVRI